MRTIDLKSRRFGRLLVIEKEDKDNHGSITWKCKCDCGSETIVVSYSLTRGTTTSCGCYARERKKQALQKAKGYCGITNLLWYYKNSAKKRKLPWRLTRDQVMKLTKENCHYCESKPFQIWKGSRHSTEASSHASYVGNGLDRLDNKKGYIITNVVPCCKYCNFAKRDMSKDDFLKAVSRIVEFNK